MTTSVTSLPTTSSTESPSSQFLFLLGDYLLNPFLGKFDNVGTSSDLEGLLISKLLSILYNNNFRPGLLLQGFDNLPALAYNPSYEAPRNHHLVTSGNTA